MLGHRPPHTHTHLWLPVDRACLAFLKPRLCTRLQGEACPQERPLRGGLNQCLLPSPGAPGLPGHPALGSLPRLGAGLACNCSPSRETVKEQAEMTRGCVAWGCP